MHQVPGTACGWMAAGKSALIASMVRGDGTNASYRRATGHHGQAPGRYGICGIGPEGEDDLTGWALVTGASGDIGSVVARRLARDGYDVFLHTFRQQHATDDLAEEIRKRGRRALVLRANFAAPGATGRFADQVAEATGGVRVMVAAAASGVMRPVTQLTERHLDWAFAVNVRAVSLLVTRLRPAATVALTSPGSQRVVPGYGGVGPAKAALESLVRYLAVELAPDCRVNALSAGLVDTRAARLLPGWAELTATMPARTPLGRLVTAEDVADAAAWLVSGQAAMVTGATLVLDGGRVLPL
jgi:enoyl-[acyl-carrier protein] reductase III